MHKHPKRVDFRHANEEKISDDIINSEGITRLWQMIGNFLKNNFEQILLDLRHKKDTIGVFLNLLVTIMWI